MLPFTWQGTRRYRVGITPSTIIPLASPVCSRDMAMSERSRCRLSLGRGSWSAGTRLDCVEGGSGQPYLKSETSPQWSRPEPQPHLELAEQGQESTIWSVIGGV